MRFVGTGVYRYPLDAGMRSISFYGSGLWWPTGSLIYPRTVSKAALWSTHRTVAHAEESYCRHTPLGALQDVFFFFFLTREAFLIE